MARAAPTLRIDGLEGLSRRARAFVEQHPGEARLAVAAALEAAARQHQAQSGGASTAIPPALKPFVVQRPPRADMIGVSEAAARLKVSRTTVYDWARKGILLAWRSTKHGLTIPAEQILGPGKVVAGLADVLAIMEDPELAWSFLAEEWPFADEVARPIDKLKRGEVDEVIGAAPAFGTAVT